MIHAHTRDRGFKNSRLVTMERIAKRTGKPNALLASKPECDTELHYLWEMYNCILKGCDKIGYVEIESYQHVYDIKLSRFEIDLMIDVDLMRRNKK